MFSLFPGELNLGANKHLRQEAFFAWNSEWLEWLENTGFWQWLQLLQMVWELYFILDKKSFHNQRPFLSPATTLTLVVFEMSFFTLVLFLQANEED